MSCLPPSLAFMAAVTLGPMASSVDAFSAERDLLPYGPKAAMTITITGRSSLDTDHAEITLDNTRANSKGFCGNSNGDDGETCAGKMLADAKIQSSILANCLTGKFTSPWGNGFRFIGRAASGNFYYIVQPDDVPHEVLDYRANYDVAIAAFKALCPARVAEADREDPVAEVAEELGPDDAEDAAPDVAEQADYTAPGLWPVSAAQVIEDHGTVYAEMASVEQVCSFLGSPSLSALADLQALNRELYEQSFREFSAVMNLWLVTKTKSVGLDDSFAAFPSNDTSHELHDRFALCFGLHSNDPQFLRVLNIVFDERNSPPSLNFLRPYFGKPEIDLEALVFMASMKDGNEYLNKYLQSTASQLASRVTNARKNQAAQSPTTATGSDQAPDQS